MVVRAEVFDRIKHLMESDHRELRSLLARSSEGNSWDEPGLEAYDSYPVVS